MTPARRTPRSSTSRAPTRRSRSTTRRSRSTRRSGSSTATRSPRPTRSCSGRRSSATSSNGAQIVIDQFLVAGRSKWGQTSRLTLLLPARLRGQRPRALERPARALPPARRAGQHPDRQLHDRRRSTSTCSAGRRSTPTARPLIVMTPKGLLRLKAAGVDARGARERAVPARHRRPVDRPLGGAPARALLAGRSTTTSSGTRPARPRRTSPSPASSSSIRSRSRPWRELVSSLPVARARSSGRRRSRRTWAPGGRSATGSTRPPARALACAGSPTSGAPGGEPERGLPDRAPARAGPHRARGARRTRHLVVGAPPHDV